MEIAVKISHKIVGEDDSEQIAAAKYVFINLSCSIKLNKS